VLAISTAKTHLEKQDVGHKIFLMENSIVGVKKVGQLWPIQEPHWTG